MKITKTTSAFSLATVVASAALFLGVQVAKADVKIAVVDMQKALQTVDAGKKAKSQLEKEFNEKKTQLQSEEESIKKLTEEFKKKNLVLSAEAQGKKQAELQEKIMKYRELVGKSQMEMQKRERDLTEPIIGRLRGVVEEVAKGQGFTMVLDKNENSVLFVQPKDDLTDEVVKTFNKKNG